LILCNNIGANIVPITVTIVKQVNIAFAFDCTKGTFSLGETSLNVGSKTFDIGMVYYIYGVQNNKCHIREHLGNSDMHCYLPINIAKKYAEEGIYTLNASMKNGTAYSQYINQIINDENYCKSNY
jgi:hypothetical protein